jgi:hypothetical protein
VAAPPGAPHATTDFAGVPARLQSDMRAIRDKYPALEARLLATFERDLSGAELERAVNRTFMGFAADARPRLAAIVEKAAPIFTAEAEKMLHGAPRLTVHPDTLESLSNQMAAQMFGPDRECQARLLDAIRRGAKGDDLKALTYGFQRADGARISLAKAGQARVRTAVNAIQAEAQLTRFRADERVKQVQFVAGGPCKYHGLGGTCTDLDGMVFPVDAIPEWARIPRHPYSNSRWVPYVDIPGVDTGGPPPKFPPEDGSIPGHRPPEPPKPASPGSQAAGPGPGQAARSQGPRGQAQQQAGPHH